jgi:hypothetical protein
MGWARSHRTRHSRHFPNQHGAINPERVRADRACPRAGFDDQESEIGGSETLRPPPLRRGMAQDAERRVFKRVLNGVNPIPGTRGPAAPPNAPARFCEGPPEIASLNADLNVKDERRGLGR